VLVRVRCVLGLQRQKSRREGRCCEQVLADVAVVVHGYKGVVFDPWRHVCFFDVGLVDRCGLGLHLVHGAVALCLSLGVLRVDCVLVAIALLDGDAFSNQGSWTKLYVRSLQMTTT